MCFGGWSELGRVTRSTTRCQSKKLIRRIKGIYSSWTIKLVWDSRPRLSVEQSSTRLGTISETRLALKDSRDEHNPERRRNPSAGLARGERRHHSRLLSSFFKCAGQCLQPEKQPRPGDACAGRCGAGGAEHSPGQTSRRPDQQRR